MAVQLIYTAKGQPYIDQYNTYKAQQAKEHAAGLTQMANARNAYLKNLADTRTAYRKEQQGIYDTTTKKMSDDNTKAQAQSNAEYDKTGRQNYINYMQAQKRLPNELNALGIRGGASESSLIRLGNTYGSNVASNEASRASALAALKKAYADNLAAYNKEYRNLLAQYDDTYNSNRTAYEDKYNTQVYDYNNTYKNNLANAYLTAYQNQINWEREQQQKDLEYFSGAIEGLYGDTASYDSLISQLENSKDPNREYKIMLARKAKQTLADKLAEAAAAYSGGGGGGYSYDGGGGYSGYSGYDYDDDNSGGGGSVRKAAKKVASQAGRAVTSAVKKSSSHVAQTRSVKGDTYTVTARGSYRQRRR